MSQRQGYRIRVGEREHEVEVTIDSSGARTVTVDGEPFEVAEAGAHALRVSEGSGRQRSVTLAGEPRPSEAWIAGARVQLQVQTEQEARLAEALGKSAGATGSGALTAPMPGRVVEILVSVGELIEHGAPVLIVEAMKMENELQAPTGGIVREIAVAKGDTVESGQVLLQIEAPDDAAPNDAAPDDAAPDDAAPDDAS